MKKSYSFLISILISFFVFMNFYSFESKNLESIIIKRVIDGDTLVSYDDRVLRLANINAPEKGVFGYNLSLIFLSHLIDKKVEIESISMDNTNTREVIRLYYEGNYINLKLVELGFSPKAWVEDEELNLFYLSEKNAIEEELGIWEKSQFTNCVNFSLNAIEEELSLYSKCTEINFKGWTIRDESREYLVINSSSNPLKIYSGSSIKYLDKNSLFWKAENIWNNDKDTLYLFDKEKNLVLYYPYGYG